MPRVFLTLAVLIHAAMLLAGCDGAPTRLSSAEAARTTRPERPVATTQTPSVRASEVPEMPARLSAAAPSGNGGTPTTTSGSAQILAESPVPLALVPAVTAALALPTPTLAPTGTPAPPTPTSVSTATPVPPTATPVPPTPTPTLPPLHNTQNTRWLQRSYPALYRQIQLLPWVEDGVADPERETIDQLLYLGVGSISNLESTLALPWLGDVVTEAEHKIIYWLSALDFEDEDAAGRVLALPWIQDGVSAPEGDAVRWLHSVAYRDETSANRIIRMPFLESLEPDDLLALRGMHNLAVNGHLSFLLGRPALEGGITDAETALVAAAATVSSLDEIGRMLSPGYTRVETASLSTKKTPYLKISIFRTGTQSKPWTAEAVRDAVEFAENKMGQALPVDHVVLVLDQHAVTGSFAGTNHGFAIGYMPDREDAGDLFDQYKFQLGLVHEVAHYYWSGNADWIDEGLASVFEYMFGLERRMSPGLLENRRRYCDVHDLQMLTDWDPTRTSNQFHCNYYLGESLFRDLLESLGEPEFIKRLRQLHQLSAAQQEEDTTPGIETVVRMFSNRGDITDEHWSGGLNAPENRPFDEGAGRTHHGLVQWDQYPVYDGGWVRFRGTLLQDAVLSQETIRQAMTGGYSNFSVTSADGNAYLGSILPPLNDGSKWVLDDAGGSVASEYRLSGSEFSVRFPFPAVLENPSEYVVIVWGFRDGRRNSDMGRDVDVLGFARIRTP